MKLDLLVSSFDHWHKKQKEKEEREGEACAIYIHNKFAFASMHSRQTIKDQREIPIEKLPKPIGLKEIFK